MNYIAQAKWTYTPTSKMAIQAGMTIMPKHTCEGRGRGMRHAVSSSTRYTGILSLQFRLLKSN